MTEYALLRNGNKVGIVDVRNDGFVIDIDQDLSSFLEDIDSEFIYDGVKQKDGLLEYSVRTKKPLTDTLEVLVKAKPLLHDLGYDLPYSC